jgi:hypothetical protein
MVRTTVHTCKECDKNYKSYQSLCNHRTKKHKMTNIDQGKYEVNINNDLGQYKVNVDNTSTLSDIETVKEYNCRKCNKVYKYKQSRWFHEKSCSSTEIIPIKNKNTEIIQNQSNINNSQIIENQNNNTNNGTINNNTTIILNNYGQENIEYLKDELIKNTLIKLSKHDDDSLKNAVPRIAQFLHFNQFHKENNNVEINSIKSKTAKKYINGKWKYVKKDDMLKDVHNKIVELLQKWVNTHRLEITRAMMGGLKDYKLVSTKYIKKMIHEEINLLGYVYYKNYMEEQMKEETEC